MRELAKAAAKHRFNFIDATAYIWFTLLVCIGHHWWGILLLTVMLVISVVLEAIE